MSRYIINTTDTYTKCVVDYDSELVGKWPKLYIRVSYKMFIRLTAYGSWNINGCTFNFAGKKTYFNLNISAPSGGADSGYLVRETIDLPVSGKNPTQSYSTAVSVTTSLWSGSATFPITATVPNPYSYGINSVSDIQSTSAVVSYRFTDNYGFYRVRLLVMPGSKLYTPDQQETSGSYRVTGLTPETQCTVALYFVDRDNVQRGNSTSVSFKTLADQLRVTVRQNGTLKTAKMYVKCGGQVKKVLNAYVRQGDALKPVNGGIEWHS